LVAANTVEAQISGPNRPGPGSSPGTFQLPGASATGDVSGSASSNVGDTIQPPPVTSTAPIINDNTQPRIGDLDARSRINVHNSTTSTPDSSAAQADSLRARSAFPSSRDWESGVGAAAGAETGGDRLTPPPHVRVKGESGSSAGGTAGSSSTALGTNSARLGSDLNTTGVNTPPRVNEQPLDRALSAKIRSQLSQTVGTNAAMSVSGEVVRELRITSQNGNVTLEGTVDDQKQKEAIEIRAKEVQGVASIQNRIQLRDRSVGAPASSDTGKSDASSSIKGKGGQGGPASGQSEQNSSDLNESDLTDSHSETAPDK